MFIKGSPVLGNELGVWDILANTISLPFWGRVLESGELNKTGKYLVQYWIHRAALSGLAQCLPLGHWFPSDPQRVAGGGVCI